MNKLGLHLMTWKDIETLFNESNIILIPMGSMEQHGSHSINGDFLAATEIAERISRNLELPYLPTVPFGNSNYFASYPGTISLREETVTNIIIDIINSLIKHEQYKLVFINGHAGNKSSINNAVRKIKSTSPDLNVITLNLWQLLNKEQKATIYEESCDPSGHGSEPLSSIMRYLYPEEVEDSKTIFENSKVNKEHIEIMNLNDASLNGLPFNIYYDMNEIATEGRYSNEFIPTSERGERLLELISENAIDIIKNYYEV